MDRRCGLVRHRVRGRGRLAGKPGHQPASHERPDRGRTRRGVHGRGPGRLAAPRPPAYRAMTGAGMAAQAPGRVVLGVDVSLAGLAAVRFAVAYARATGMPLHTVRAWAAPHWRDQAALRWRLQIAEQAHQTLL